jgi:LysR family transcriptional regulator, glycine cleavage system transcriptional activator
MPLIEADIAAGRLICPIAAPEWDAGSYQLVTNEERIRVPAVRAFRDWIKATARKTEAPSQIERRRWTRMFWRPRDPCLLVPPSHA